MRWALDGRSYALKKGMGTSCMASVFKDYSEHGVGLLLLTDEDLEKVNDWRKGRFYKTKIDGKQIEMKQLNESPGMRVIDHSVAGEGYWNYNKMAIQCEDAISTMDLLRPHLQQLHQFD